MRRVQGEDVLVLIAEDEREWALTDFERALGEALLAGRDPRLRAARAQFAVARAMKRHLTGEGFLIDLYLPPETPAGDVSMVATPLGEAWITASDLAEPLEALFSAERGMIRALEVCRGGGKGGTPLAFERIEALIFGRGTPAQISVEPPPRGP